MSIYLSIHLQDNKLLKVPIKVVVGQYYGLVKHAKVEYDPDIETKQIKDPQVIPFQLLEEEEELKKGNELKVFPPISI